MADPAWHPARAKRKRKAVHQNIWHLLRTRRFLPFFVTQFLSAFNDNIFRFAMVILLKYQAGLTQEVSQLLTTLAAGIFIFPFFLFSALAGQLADKFEKSNLIQWIRFSEIPLMVLAGIGFYLKSPALLLTVLFLMGTKSSFFGPLKYSILPEHLRRDELIGGNGLVEMATFLAILLGTIIGGLLIAEQGGRMQVSGLVLVLAVTGYVASRFIPLAPARVPELAVNPNFVGEIFRVARAAAAIPPVIISIIGISWLWFLGATFLAQFPNFARDVLGGDEGVATLFLFSLSAGIGVGSLLCNRLLKGLISARLAPLMLFVIAAFCIELFLAASAWQPLPEGKLMAVGEFLARFGGWRILFDLFVIAVAGGIYIVPLYSILQTRSGEQVRARMIAANNIINSLFMVVSAAGAIGLFALGLTVTDIFLTIGMLSAGFGLFFAFNKGWENRG